MARQTSLNILLESTGKDNLAEEYGKVIENVQKGTISDILKNKELSGDPAAGSVEAKRFTNTASATYGSARSAHAAAAVKARPVTVNIDKDKELLNEVEQKDADMYGVEDLIARKAKQNEASMKAELDRAFFTEAAASGTSATLTGTDIQEQVEELIQLVETTKNDFVDGVDRDMIAVVLDPSMYGALRTYIDGMPTGNVDTNIAEIGMYHGVMVASSTRLPKVTVGEGEAATEKQVKAVAMALNSIAQPVSVTVADPEKIPLSNAYSFGIFFSYGTKAVTPDLIQYVHE